MPTKEGPLSGNGPPRPGGGTGALIAEVKKLSFDAQYLPTTGPLQLNK